LNKDVIGLMIDSGPNAFAMALNKLGVPNNPYG